MTQPGYRHRIIIIDRSGSMLAIQAGMQSGLAEFLESERAVPGSVTVSLWDFDDEIRRVHAFESLDHVAGYRLQPRGWTALYDAVGDAVDLEGSDLAALPEDQRPEDVTVLIVSDGQENCSQRRTGTHVRDVLAHQQEKYGWRVLYLGTNQDALAESEKIGGSRQYTLNYAATSAGSQGAWAATASALRRAPVTARASGQSLSFTQEERDAAAGARPAQPAQPAQPAPPASRAEKSGPERQQLLP